MLKLRFIVEIKELNKLYREELIECFFNQNEGKVVVSVDLIYEIFSVLERVYCKS